MAYNNNVSVRIAGKTMVLSGNESVEYITKVANYIEDKADNLRKSDNSKSLNANLISVLTSINIADDFFKEKAKNEKLVNEIQEAKNLSTNISEITLSGETNSEDIEAFESEILRLTKEIDESFISNQKVAEDLAVVTVERDSLLKETEELKQKVEELQEEVRQQIAKINHIKSNGDRKYAPNNQEENKENINMQYNQEQDKEDSVKPSTNTVEIQEAIRTEPQKHGGIIKNYYRNT